MKFKFIFVTFFSFLFYSNLFLGIDIPIFQERKLLAVNSDKDQKDLDIQAEYAAGNVRGLGELIENNIAYQKTAFSSANYFYLGADHIIIGTVGPGQNSLVRVLVQLGESPDQNELGFISLTPAQVNINRAQTEEKEPAPIFVDSPLFDGYVTNLSLFGRLPIITINNNDPASDNKYVYLITDIEEGKFIERNDAQINDADGNATSGIVGLSSNGGSIFAAVAPEGDVFGAENSGIALLIRDQNKLKPINAQTGNKDENKAFKLDLTANQLLAINQDATVGALGDMYWDSSLSRLFIGLKNVQSSANPGGVVSVLVGRFGDEGKLILEPLVALDQNLFNADDDKFIFGFYYTAGIPRASSYKVRTMKTSTGKNYLIVNGCVANGEIGNQVYAVPLISSSDDKAKIGKVANKNDFTQLPANAGEMSLNNENPVFVGCLGSDSLIQPGQSIQDMFVVGDSVFVCVAQDRSAVGNEAGIFKSTAVFDETGKIRKWTQWQRVGANIDKVFGAGLDKVFGNYWYLTGNGQNFATVTQWGKSTEKNYLMGNGLVALLGEEFEQENAGVHQIFNFDEKTPSIARSTAANEVSIMVATGFQKIALIQTGEGSPFVPTQTFVKDTNVFIKEDDALKEIGPICCADFSRIVYEDGGYLFVGGHEGVAVLRQVDGNGWDGSAGAAALNLQTISGWSFKKLLKDDGNSFKYVRKLFCDGYTNFLYVLTNDKLYRVLMNPDKFKDVDPIDLSEKEISTPVGTLLDAMIFYSVDDNVRILVSTTTGVYFSNDINNTDENKNNVIWTKVTLPNNAIINGPVSHLSFISTEKGGFTRDGNLYVLANDFALNLADVYRFDVEGGEIKHITVNQNGPYEFYEMGELRSDFIPDGTFGYNLLSKHFNKIEFLRKLNFGDNQTSMRLSDINIDLDVPDNAHNVGVIVQNSASGAWIVPGDWGIRVNE